VPAYNAEEYIVCCLDSLLNQTLKEIEIIIINDGSVDNTLSILNNYKSLYPNNIVVIDSSNQGAGASRRKGTEIAKGEYIAYVDADDWVDIDMYHSLYSEAIKGFDVVVCDIVRKSTPDSATSNVIKAFAFIHPISQDDFMKRLHMSCSSCNKLFKASLLKKLDFKWPDIYYEDIGYVPAVVSFATKIKYIEKNLYFYRINATSFTSISVDGHAKVQAYKWGIKHCNPDKKVEFLSSAAAALVEKEYNSSIFKNYKVNYFEFIQYLVNENYSVKVNKTIIDIINTTTLPKVIHIMNIGYRKYNIHKIESLLFKMGLQFKIIVWNETNLAVDALPVIKRAFDNKDYIFLNDYFKLYVLYKYGGIAIDYNININIGFANIIFQKFAIGYLDGNTLSTKVLASQPTQRILLDMLATYRFSLYRESFTSLGERLVDYIRHFYGFYEIGSINLMTSTKFKFMPPSEHLVRLDKRNSWFYVEENDDKYQEYKGFALKDVFKRLDNQSFSSKEELDSLHFEVNSLRKSTSWKITKPLRIIGDFHKKLTKR
jgi:glycosyltransferase involved in cell wall biosynthesis